MAHCTLAEVSKETTGWGDGWGPSHATHKMTLDEMYEEEEEHWELIEHNEGPATEHSEPLEHDEFSGSKRAFNQGTSHFSTANGASIYSCSITSVRNWNMVGPEWSLWCHDWQLWPPAKGWSCHGTFRGSCRIPRLSATEHRNTQHTSWSLVCGLKEDHIAHNSQRETRGRETERDTQQSDVSHKCDFAMWQHTVYESHTPSHLH